MYPIWLYRLCALPINLSLLTAYRGRSGSILIYPSSEGIMNVLTTVPYETLSPAQDAQWTDTVCHEIVKRYIIYHSFNMSSSSFSKKIDPFSLWSIACELHWKGVLLPDFLETRIQETCLKSSLLSIRHLRVCSGFYILHKFKWFQSSSSFCHRSGSLLVSRQCGRGHRISPHRPWVVLPVTTR